MDLKKLNKAVEVGMKRLSESAKGNADGKVVVVKNTGGMWWDITIDGKYSKAIQAVDAQEAIKTAVMQVKDGRARINV